MIRYKDIILEEYSIDPETAVITNLKDEIQKTKIIDGRPYFKRHCIHQWQVHTHIGYKEGYDIHHLDHDKMNNSLSNLVYLTRSEHAKLHANGRILSEDTKRKISEAHSGTNNYMYGKKYKWINNGIEQRYIPFDEYIPEGFVKGMLKMKINRNRNVGVI